MTCNSEVASASVSNQYKSYQTEWHRLESSTSSPTLVGMDRCPEYQRPARAPTPRGRVGGHHRSARRQTLSRTRLRWTVSETDGVETSFHRSSHPTFCGQRRALPSPSASCDWVSADAPCVLLTLLRVHGAFRPHHHPHPSHLLAPLKPTFDDAFPFQNLESAISILTSVILRDHQSQPDPAL